MHSRNHTGRLIAQALSLVIPLGAAAGILLAVHPLPATLAAPLTLLIALALTRVLHWLDLGGDIDTGLKISELMRKPG